MIKWLYKKLTKSATEIPLFYINFNLEHYKKHGKEKSCMAHIHPVLQDDEYIKESLKNIIDYIRDKYDMDEML